MTKFDKNLFSGSEYITYGDEGKFVARFKYARSSKHSFISFLIKNFSVEEYFSRQAKGEAPLTILQSKGYLQPHVKKALKEAGYEISMVGFKQMIEDRVSVIRGEV